MKRVMCLLLAMLTLSSCGVIEKSKNEKKPTGKEISAVWISYTELSMKDENGGNEDSFRDKISEMFDNCAQLGINTVFAQVRPFCDAMYPSEIFPWSAYLTGYQGDPVYYDPLEIMVEEAHERGLGLHAWINPFRVSFDTDTDKLSEKNPAKKLLSDEKTKDRVVTADGGLYLCPASTENHKLIIDGVREIIRNYEVDGIHIDDYFYPSTDISVDKTYYEEYKKSGGALFYDKWRLEVISSFVSQMYTAVKSERNDCVLSISPAGNINNNYEEEYADVERWCSEKGYCDWIIPQIYYGFENEVIPFDKACKSWSELDTTDDVRMIYGIPAYKVNGEEDEFKAGRGIIEKQISAAKATDNYGGVAFFSYSSLVDPDCKKEFENIKSSVFTELAVEEEGQQSSGNTE
ncbi:MAG: glycoside hydrolase family 10 protein [Acutalibacteraceae bacterium]